MAADENAVALRIIRSIFDAADPFDVEISGTSIHVSPTPGPQPAWPRPIVGLDPTRDGPWPRPVFLECTWKSGKARLRLEIDVWSGKGPYRDQTGIAVRLEQPWQSLVWITLAHLVPNEAGQRVQAPSSIALGRRRQEAAEASVSGLTADLRQHVESSGLPMVSRHWVETFVLDGPEGVIVPDARTAYRRLVHVALLKLPYMVRGRWPQEMGQPYLSLPRILTPAATSADSSEPGYRSVRSLPGGVRQYKETLEELLAWVADEPRTKADLDRHLEVRYQVHGSRAKPWYARQLATMGVVEPRDDYWTLTTTGESYLEDPTPSTLFRILHGRFQGFLAILVLMAQRGAVTTIDVTNFLNHLLGTEWGSQNQAAFRLNWLLSSGLTDRTPEGDILTEVGRGVLAEFAQEAGELQGLLEEISAPEPLQPGDSSEKVDDEPGDESTSTASVVRPDAPGWNANRLDLVVSVTARHLVDLSLSPTFAEQACAALSAGKHLLLVGPPGTGKTRIAAALCASAAAEGYTTGPLMATASADWTTFETIGGYALDKQQHLVFRPGVFLRAISERRWLILDEINRADVDRAFGELMTVLSGVGAETAFLDDRGQVVSVGPEEGRSHRVPPTFRVIATMNTWDKTSLFRLSYAVQRRFAILPIDPPPPDAYARLLRDAADREGMDPELDKASADKVVQLFSLDGLLAHRALGPAIPLDVIHYLRRRKAGGDALGEALILYVLPQLEGLGDQPARQVFEFVENLLTGWASDGVRAEVARRIRDQFPHVRFGPDE